MLHVRIRRLYGGGVVTFAWRGIQGNKCAVWLLILASAFHASTSRTKVLAKFQRARCGGLSEENVSQLSGVNVYDELLLGVSSSCVVYVANYRLFSAYNSSRSGDLQQWPLHVAQCVWLSICSTGSTRKGYGATCYVLLKWENKYEFCVGACSDVLVGTM